jgi:hypothetical protein
MQKSTALFFRQANIRWFAVYDYAQNGVEEHTRIVEINGSNE